jgi:hypothetical protein
MHTMARRDPTFSDTDVVRIIRNNLTTAERERVICLILISTGKINGRVSGAAIIKFLRDFRGGPIGEIIGALVDLAGDPKFDADY